MQMPSERNLNFKKNYFKKSDANLQRCMYVRTFYSILKRGIVVCPLCVVYLVLK